MTMGSREQVNLQIRKLWLAYADLLDKEGTDVFTKLDCALWGQVTIHPAVQDKLTNEKKSIKDWLMEKSPVTKWEIVIICYLAGIGHGLFLAKLIIKIAN